MATESETLMRLIVNPVRGTIRTEDGTFLELEKHYPLEDGVHTFIFFPVGNARPPERLLAWVRRGRKGFVQRATIFLMGHTAPFPIDITPDASPFPLEETINRLIQKGVDKWRIVPLFGNGRLETKPLPDTSRITASSDAVVTKRDIPPETQPSSIAFKVQNAKWAILHNKQDIQFVFVWPEIVGSEEERALLNAVG